jgi:pSer/pThr/pTyr-binding forkhead associated (FHA) protein
MHNSKQMAPDVFTLVVHPDSAEMWQREPRLLEGLTQILRMAIRELDLHTRGQPTITFATDPSVDADEIHILSSHKVDRISETKGIPRAKTGELDSPENMPKNAFLIIGGVKVFPLNQPVVNIGRRVDNHLVLDDPRVSRYHAQIRAIKGRFVLFDLNSTGGTYVNGQRINQTVLYPGDVISLAGLPVIFGQDNPPPYASAANTSPIPMAASERPTAILKSPDGKEGQDLNPPTTPVK